MSMKPSSSVQNFDPARARDYEQQARIALAGYDACHELSACLLTAAIGSGTQAHILVAGAGGGAREIVTAGKLEPAWHFTAVDPSPSMMDIAIARLNQEGLMERTQIHLGFVDDLPSKALFDGVTLIGVLHHLSGNAAKLAILRALAVRLKLGAPLILACNRYAYASQPLLLKAWGERWRMQGATKDEVDAKLGTILQSADPPHSDAEVIEMLAESGV